MNSGSRVGPPPPSMIVRVLEPPPSAPVGAVPPSTPAIAGPPPPSVMAHRTPQPPPMAPMSVIARSVSPPTYAATIFDGIDVRELSQAAMDLIQSASRDIPRDSQTMVSKRILDYLMTYWEAQSGQLKKSDAGMLEVDYARILRGEDDLTDRRAIADFIQQAPVERVRLLADELDGVHLSYYAPVLGKVEQNIVAALHDLGRAMIFYKASGFAPSPDDYLMLTLHASAEGALQYARHRFADGHVPRIIREYAENVEGLVSARIITLGRHRAP